MAHRVRAEFRGAGAGARFVDVSDVHEGTLFDKARCDARADAARRTGHKRNLAFQAALDSGIDLEVVVDEVADPPA